MQKSPFTVGLSILGWLLGLGAVAAGIFGIVAGCEARQRGIYGGTSYGDAKNRVADILVHRYGVPLTRSLHYKGEDKTHLLGDAGGPQARLFKFIGPRGVKYCITLWDGGGYIKSQAQKGPLQGCSF